MDCGCYLVLISWGLAVVSLITGLGSENPRWLVAALVFFVAPFAAMAISNWSEDRKRHFKP